METSADLRTCIVCKRSLPQDRFYASGHGNGRRNTCTRCLNEAGARERRANGARIRHTRYNARGHVWCNRCATYLPASDFKRHPSRPHTYWSYCKPCTREIDRERYARKTSTMEGAQQVLDARLQRRRRQQANERSARKRWVMHCIEQLVQRGFTRAEIARLADVSVASLLAWIDPKSKRRITSAVEARFSVLVLAAGDLPRIGPQHRRRLPHPEYARIHATTIDEVRRHKVRNGWINGRRGGKP